MAGMNDNDINLSLRLASEWTQQEVAALSNAYLWLTQSANGEVPHGGTQPQPKEKPMDDITMDGPDMMPLEDGNE